ncbi:zinc/manganese transport system ATP-binding protein [Tamaricihabitans halophyticus]|uniref:Zinc/manganese transport system ATP-binding protein n=1 Tax=Tamaricihabitans halophyticus TaxID=1262583 RepID=A0A4R2QXY3_9PSEU|nr:zinc ABC transporter ATP-binding protein AztA [Tamaricihabitans halophyticus]TCP54244.1 zinc/manganese transport system ATP-binding protein [Tamaricihabitans halophyticus]
MAQPDPVTVTGLSAGYPGRTVLHEVTARFPAASVTAIVGPNGSGKSTLLSTVAGVLSPTEGTVRLPSGTRPALVVQRSEVSDRLPITVRETVTMGRWAARGLIRRLSNKDRQVVADCLRQLGITELARRRLSTLSGGQRQRALVAQGLAQNSAVLLLDEPTAGLDLAAKEAITAALNTAAAAGATVVQVTHELTDAANADHCVLLSEGRVLDTGAPSAVLTEDALRTAWGLCTQPSSGRLHGK